MIWSAPGLKHLGSQSRLSVPLGLSSSAGDYQMQTTGGMVGGVPMPPGGVYQLPPVADTGVCVYACICIYVCIDPFYSVNQSKILPINLIDLVSAENYENCDDNMQIR